MIFLGYAYRFASNFVFLALVYFSLNFLEKYEQRAVVAILVLVDWKRFDSQWVRYALLSVLSGTIVALVVIITAWSVGPTSLVTKILSKASGHAGTVDWSSYWVAALDHVIGIGMSVAIGVAALLNLGTIMSLVGRGLRWIVDLIPWTWPEWLSRAVTKTSHVVVGDAPDRRLIRAKVYVTFWFCLFTSAVLFMADAMAAMGDARDWSLNFFFIATLLTVLNWASFSVRQWKGRAGLGLVTAALVFLSYPMVARNPIMFPKIVVTLLGLGNERLASIGLSSKQCATLAPYGVNCAADNERGFTLTDVNLLSRLGGSIVLELLVTTGALERGIATSCLSQSCNRVMRLMPRRCAVSCSLYPRTRCWGIPKQERVRTAVNTRRMTRPRPKHPQS